MQFSFRVWYVHATRQSKLPLDTDVTLREWCFLQTLLWNVFYGSMMLFVEHMLDKTLQNSQQRRRKMMPLNVALRCDIVWRSGRFSPLDQDLARSHSESKSMQKQSSQTVKTRLPNRTSQRNWMRIIFLIWMMLRT